MTMVTNTGTAPSGLTTANAQERWRGSLMDNYGTPPIALVRGRGARVWDVEGREYVDLLAGIAVNALGHAHPDVVAAISEQAATLGHTSNLAMTLPAIALALLAALEIIPRDAAESTVALGELSLDGRLIPVAGALPAAMAAAEEDRALLCPRACGAEAAPLWAPVLRRFMDSLPT